MAEQRKPSLAGSKPLMFTLACWLVMIIVCEFAYRPPTALTVDAPSHRFSAWRADKHLKRLVGDAIPHPAGSQQNEIVRNRVVAVLKEFGYEPELQSTSAKLLYRRTDDDPDTVPLTNLLARLPATESDVGSKLGAVMLVCHFDSVPFGPGASDDGVGVAVVLEIARMLKSNFAARRDVFFLFTDGEEFGLLGAKQFAAENPRIEEVEFFVNLEARGTSGASLLFQTSRDSQFMINLFRGSVTRPVSSSVFAEVYKRLPNDTDFTVFNKHGLRGFNFALIGDARKYHTADDNYENVNRDSMQHHGDNALTLIKELSMLPEAEFEPMDNGSRRLGVVYFDILSRWLVSWPERWSLIVSCSLVVLFIAIAAVGLRVSDHTLFSIADLAIVAAALISVLLLGWLIHFGLSRDGRLDAPWTDQPFFILLTFWSVMLATYSFASLKLKHASSVWMIVWGGGITLSVVASVYVAGASYFFLIPSVVACMFALVCGLPAMVRKFSDRNFHWLCSGVLAAVVAGLVYLPMERLFYDAIGFRWIIVLSLRSALLGATLLPILAASKIQVRQMAAHSFLGIAVIALILSVLLN